MRRLITSIAAATLLLCAGCTENRDQEKPKLAVSIPAQKWLLDSIVGDRFEVVAMLTDGSNPETFEPSMRQLKDLESARAIFTVGGLPFEQGMLPKIRENFPQMQALPSDTYIERIEGTHCGVEGHEDGHGGHHHDGDPHIWTSLRNASLMARDMYERVSKLDPAGKEYYRKRYETLAANLKSLDDSVAAALAPWQGRSIIVWHPSLSYFVRDYGLKQISVENEGKEASAAQYRRQLDLASRERPAVFFLQSEFDSRQGEAMARELGLRTAPLSVMQPDIAAQIRQITHDITHNPTH